MGIHDDINTIHVDAKTKLFTNSKKKFDPKSVTKHLEEPKFWPPQMVGNVRQTVTCYVVASALLGGVVGLGVGWVAGRASGRKGT